MESRLTQKGQVTIPSAIRSQFGLKPWERDCFTIENDEGKVDPALSILLRGYRRFSSNGAPLDDRVLREEFERGVAEEVLSEDC